MSKKSLAIGFCVGVLVAVAGCGAFSRKYELVHGNAAYMYRINTWTGETWVSIGPEWEKMGEPAKK